MFPGGIMNAINNRITFVVAAILSALLVFEPTTDLVVTIMSLPFQVIRMVLGFVLGIVNWPMLAMVAIGFTVAYLAKTRYVNWTYIKGLFSSEEV
jgi:hypothetical protein